MNFEAMGGLKLDGEKWSKNNLASIEILKHQAETVLKTVVETQGF